MHESDDITQFDYLMDYTEMTPEQQRSASPHELVSHHYKLVKKIACKWLGHGVPFEDVFQEGALALCIAAGRFDGESGADFTPYAQAAVKHAIERMIRKDTQVVIPAQSLGEVPRPSYSTLGINPDAGEIDLIDERAIDPDDVADAALRADRVEQVLSSLGTRDSRVMKHLLGYEDGVPKTPNEVAELEGVSDRMIRKIRSRVEAKLRGGN